MKEETRLTLRKMSGITLPLITKTLIPISV
jgi:hypothetical protein